MRGAQAGTTTASDQSVDVSARGGASGAAILGAQSGLAAPLLGAAGAGSALIAGAGDSMGTDLGIVGLVGTGVLVSAELAATGVMVGGTEVTAGEMGVMVGGTVACWSFHGGEVASDAAARGGVDAEPALLRIAGRLGHTGLTFLALGAVSADAVASGGGAGATGSDAAGAAAGGTEAIGGVVGAAASVGTAALTGNVSTTLGGAAAAGGVVGAAGFAVLAGGPIRLSPIGSAGAGRVCAQAGEGFSSWGVGGSVQSSGSADMGAFFAGAGRVCAQAGAGFCIGRAGFGSASVAGTAGCIAAAAAGKGAPGVHGRSRPFFSLTGVAAGAGMTCAASTVTGSAGGICILGSVLDSIGGLGGTGASTGELMTGIAGSVFASTAGAGGPGTGGGASWVGI